MQELHVTVELRYSWTIELLRGHERHENVPTVLLPTMPSKESHDRASKPRRETMECPWLPLTKQHKGIPTMGSRRQMYRSVMDNLMPH